MLIDTTPEQVIVDDTNSKEFYGKDSVKSRDIGI